MFSTDKTTLSVFSGDKTAYPVYMTLGNIPKDVRRKPSLHAQILVAYLPTTKLDGVDYSDGIARTLRARLYHAAMSIVLAPLKPISHRGAMLECGDGGIRHAFTIPAVLMLDYPEQCLATAVRYGVSCPQGLARKEQFGKHVVRKPTHAICTPRVQEETLAVLAEVQELPPGQRNALLKEYNLNFISEPFWKGFAHCNVHRGITSDILHMLLQGIVKHLVEWLTAMMGSAELDARFRALPPASGVRHFTNGISGLVNISGNEHREIAKQLVVCLIGRAPPPAIQATRALIDFVELAQYRSHTTSSLGYLIQALDDFHANKDVFLRAFGAKGIRTHISFP